MKNEIILFENQDVKLEVNMKDETVWLNREQSAVFFGRNIETIGKHINDALNEELDNSVVVKFTTTELFDLLRTNIIEEYDILRKFGNSELSGKSTIYTIKMLQFVLGVLQKVMCEKFKIYNK